MWKPGLDMLRYWLQPAGTIVISYSRQHVYVCTVILLGHVDEVVECLYGIGH